MEFSNSHAGHQATLLHFIVIAWILVLLAFRGAHKMKCCAIKPHDAWRHEDPNGKHTWLLKLALTFPFAVGFVDEKFRPGLDINKNLFTCSDFDER